MKPGYDQQQAAFVTGPHVTDEAFTRIGKSLTEAKCARGITKL